MNRLITLFVSSLFVAVTAYAAQNTAAPRVRTLDNGAKFIAFDQPRQSGKRDSRPRNPLDQGGEDCASATEISSLPYCDTGTTAGHNDDYYENCLGATGAPDVVYFFSPSVDQNISISLTSSVYTTYLQIYETSTGCNGLSFYDCNNGVPTSCVEGITVYSGYTYYIVVDGDWQESGAYILNVVEGYSCPSTPCSPPGNGGEDCDNATLIPSLPYCDQGTTVGHANDYGPNCSSDLGSADVVYKFTPTQDMFISLSLCGSAYDTYLELWESPVECADAYWWYCNGDFCGTQSCIENADIYAGYNYYIIVDGENGEDGNYQLNIVEGSDCPSTACPPSAGDICEDPISITSLPYCDSGDTGPYTDNYTPACVGVTFGEADVVYEYIPTQDLFLGITTESAVFQTTVEIWESQTGCAGAYLLGCTNIYENLDACIIGVDVYVGYQYYIYVDGLNGGYGPYTLNVYEGGGCNYTSCVGSGETCASAITVNTMPFVYSGTTMGMNDDYNSCTFESGPDVVFSYTPDSTHLANILTCGNTLFSGDLYIFRDGDVFNLFGSCAPRPCYTSYSGFWWNPAFHCFQFEVGHTYCIVLDGESPSSFGPYELTIEPVQVEACNLNDICPFPHTETEPNSMCSPREFDPDTLFLGDTIAGNICQPGDIDYYWVVTPEDRWNVIGVSAGPNCDQGNTDLGISYVFPGDCGVTAPCNNCGWISGCGPETVAVAIKGLGDCFAGTYKTFVWEYDRPIDPCDPVACDLAPVITCNVPTAVNTCDGCQTPICQTYRNGNSGTRAGAGKQKFFRLDVTSAQTYTIDLVAPIGNTYHDVQFSIFTNCTLPQTSCVYAQDQNTWWQSVTGPENEEHGSVFLTPGTYYLHVSVEGGGNCGDMTVTVGCVNTPCIPADSLTIRRQTPAMNAELRWPAHNGTYEIYSTTFPNNDGDPTGGDPQWSLVHTALYPEGSALWTDPDNSATYRNYVVIRQCP